MPGRIGMSTRRSWMARRENKKKEDLKIGGKKIIMNAMNMFY